MEMKNYIEEFTIPFLQTKVKNWDIKKQLLLNLYESRKNNFASGDQYTDYGINNRYHHQIESILIDDLKEAKKSLNIEKDSISVNSAWFQLYKQHQHHTIHNHGLGGFSSVCYIEYDKEEHEPTRFICPFNNLFDHHEIEFIPKDIEESSIIFFPSSLSHYVAPNKSKKHRLILSLNII